MQATEKPFHKYLKTLGPDGHTKTLGYVPPDSNHRLACARAPVARVRRMVRIPTHWFETLEQNQLLASCCRHPEEHDIEAWYSSPADAAKGVPDIYKFHCTCGRVHGRFVVGNSIRPKWEIR